MEKVITAIKTLLDEAIATPGSNLSDIKKVYFGDPQQIPEKSQPAIALMPISTTYEDRGPWNIQKTFVLEARLIYNQKQYYGKWNGPIVTATNGVYDAAMHEIQIQSTAHGLTAWDAVVIQCTPSKFSGTYSVSEVIDADTFAVLKNEPSESTQNLTDVTYRTVNTENIFAVLDSIRKIERVNSDLEPEDDTIAWMVTINPTLKTGNPLQDAADFAKIESVEYGFSTARGFPTYEISVRIRAVRVKRRRQ